ncbi:MAG: OmpA family protein [Proteobacteria bacterium]|nr:OmpA family protein [Pseudomonadota bacterium]
MGLKYDIDHNFAVHSGFGSEIQHGLSTPDWRVYAGLNYTMGPKPTDAKRISSDGRTAVVNPNPFLGPPKSYERVVVHDILFEFDSDERMIGPSKDTLAALSKYLNQAPGYSKLVVIGHTDSIGPTEYNDSLSKSRADTIKKWLVDHHKLDAQKIATEGRGEREPVSGNGNFQGRQLNRRVEFIIYRDRKVEKYDPGKKR